MPRPMLAFVLVGGLAASASAQVDLANWTFESSVPTTAGPHAAEHGVFAASSFASSNGAGVFSNPVGNGSLESFSANGWEIGTYFEFSTSAVGYENLTFSWMQTRSSTGPGVFDLELSIDGGAFVTLVDDYIVPVVTWQSGAVNDGGSIFPAVSLPADAANATSLVFRLVNQVTPGGSAGTSRVDNVVVRGTLIPAPGAAALLGLGALLAARRRRD